MATFRFELEAVLDVRRRAERERQLAVARLERERLETEEALRGCQREIETERRDIRDRLGTLGRGPEAGLAPVRQQAAAVVRLDARAQRLALQLAGVYQRLEGARRELAASMAARKAVELLRERRYEAWKREQDKREQSRLDELAVMSGGSDEGGEA